MKQTYTFMIFAAVLSFCLPSCSGFLEETSRDEIKPSTAQDYLELINGEIYNKYNDTPLHTYLDIMTDDCEEIYTKKPGTGIFGAKDNRISGFGYFTWQQSPEYQLSGALNSDTAWEHFYHQILVCNMILYDIDKMDGTKQEKARVCAEALMVRAYAYYMLVNLYGEPYDPKTAESALGVPINDLVGAQNKKFTRASVAKVYEKILEDAENALPLFDEAGKIGKFRWNKCAANIFLSRICLYMQDWDGAIGYADDALEENPVLWNLNEKSVEGYGTDEGRFFTSVNPEIVFSFGYDNVVYFAEGACGAYPASENLRNSFLDGDLRIGDNDGAYIRYLGSAGGFFGAGKRHCPYKGYSSSYTGVHGKAIRTAEAYLNRAEAYSHKAESFSKALDDLNMIRRNRVRPENYTELAGLSQENTVLEVRAERRRELCFEQHRWFDLRRWDRPRIVHTYMHEPNDKTNMDYYVLEENDPAYTLPIPKEVFERDSDLQNIARPERKPESVVPQI